MSKSLSFLLRGDITIKNSVCSQEITISMAHATTTLPRAFPPKIMPDKPQITEKLTNAWHLLNIHYSDTSSEFQKAERMLNQHSYSQSELQHHIAARLSADENGTLGPDSKNVQGLLTREWCVHMHVCVCVWVYVWEKATGCVSRVGMLHTLLFKHF